MPEASNLSFLETDRLTLRLPKVSDAAAYRQLWTERDPRVPAHRRIDSDGHPTEEDIAAGMLNESPKPGLLTIEQTSTGEVIGYSGLVFHGIGAPDEPELAFELLHSVHNCGYGTEAARAVIAWTDSNGYPRVWATVWDWNVASRRVLDKLGFADTGIVEGTSIHGRSLLTVRSNGQLVSSGGS